MLFKKRFDENEAMCPGCKNMVKPLIIKNKLESAPLFGYGQVGSGLPRKKHLLICPKCGYIISSK
jgi:hypothetical protein